MTTPLAARVSPSLTARIRASTTSSLLVSPASLSPPPISATTVVHRTHLPPLPWSTRRHLNLCRRAPVSCRTAACLQNRQPRPILGALSPRWPTLNRPCARFIVAASADFLHHNGIFSVQPYNSANWANNAGSSAPAPRHVLDLLPRSLRIGNNPHTVRQWTSIVTPLGPSQLLHNILRRNSPVPQQRNCPQPP